MSDSLSVSATLASPSDELSHSHFCALTVKNGIVDYMRDRTNGERPSVDVQDADVPLLLYLHRDEARLY